MQNNNLSYNPSRIIKNNGKKLIKVWNRKNHGHGHYTAVKKNGIGCPYMQNFFFGFGRSEQDALKAAETFLADL